MDELLKKWEDRYKTGDLPWDSGIRSRELARVLEEQKIAPCRTVELGAGSGTNAVFLAEQGFDVTALELSPTAVELAKKRAEDANVSVEFLSADVGNLDRDLQPFDFLFDRGCFHCVRRENLSGFRKTLKQLSRPGTRYLLLTGNANEQTEDQGPPRLHEHEIRADLGDLFEFEFVREFRFEDPGGVEGPLGWSCLSVRRDSE